VPHGVSSVYRIYSMFRINIIIRSVFGVLHTAEPLVPGPSHLEVEISIAKLKKYKSPGSDQILAELYQAGGETLVFKCLSGIRKKCLISERSLLL
jgi:hypothetical protein